MQQGRIEQVGTYHVYRETLNMFVAGFLGSPPMNFFSARRQADSVRITGADFLYELIDKPAVGQPGTVPHGDEIIDWLYVEDATRAVVLASQALNNRSIGLIICGERSTIRGVATRLKHLLPDAVLVVQSGSWGGAMHFAMATTEAEINYSPQFPLEEGLRRNINMLRTKQGLATI